MSKKSAKQKSKKNTTSKASIVASENIVNGEVSNQLSEQSTSEDDPNNYNSEDDHELAYNKEKKISGRQTYRQSGNHEKRSTVLESNTGLSFSRGYGGHEAEVVPESRVSFLDEDEAIFGNDNVDNHLNPRFPPIRLLVVIGVIIVSFVYSGKVNKTIDTDPEKELFGCIQSIREKHPKQQEILWRAIITGINGTVESESPSSYIFLHEADAEDTLKTLIDEVSKCVVCQLSDCNFAPIYLEEELEKLPATDDYGKVLTHLKSKLENSGLLVVDLGKLPGKFALAFHNICDEISPLVKKLAVFFTLKIDSFVKSPLHDSAYTEELLKKKWKHLNEDEFNPLWTRMSSMLLRIFPD